MVRKKPAFAFLAATVMLLGGCAVDRETGDRVLLGTGAGGAAGAVAGGLGGGTILGGAAVGAAAGATGSFVADQIEKARRR